MAFSTSLRSGRRRKFKSEINVVPYIDVMLVLLIIFMAVPQAKDQSVVNLPSAEKSAQPPDEFIRIEIKPNNQLTIGIKGQDSSLPENMADRRALVERLRELHKENPEHPVLIAGDRDSKYDDVIQLISEAKKLGINRVGLATQ